MGVAEVKTVLSKALLLAPLGEVECCVGQVASEAGSLTGAVESRRHLYAQRSASDSDHELSNSRCWFDDFSSVTSGGVHEHVHAHGLCPS